MNKENITITAMRKTFNKFRGSRTYAAKMLDVHPSTISLYLAGRVKSAPLDRQMPGIAAKLESTGGACIHDVNGPSVRASLRKLRRKQRRAE